MALDLKPIEAEILTRLGNGAKRKEIAEDMHISLSTVNNRLYDAQRRNAMRTIEALLAWYVREAIVQQYTGAVNGSEADPDD